MNVFLVPPLWGFGEIFLNATGFFYTYTGRFLSVTCYYCYISLDFLQVIRLVILTVLQIRRKQFLCVGSEFT